MKNISLGIIGAGNIARKHLDIIKDINYLTVTGITSRTRNKAEILADLYNINSVYDNPDDLISYIEPDALLILVSADQLFSVTEGIIKYKIPFFMEKPPGLAPNDTKALCNLTDEYDVLNMVGYNRRYYSIFHKGLDIIKTNGKLLGLTVEGHERFWKISDKISKIIRQNWIYANSTHTIDLLRFFGGEIVNIYSINNSYIEKNGDQFIAGVEFDSGTLGNYISHWYSPEGWSIRLFGEGITVIYKPLEKGVWIDSDFIEYEIKPDKIDLDYKSGFYRQMIAFGDMIQTGKLDWPGQSLLESYKTMLLAEKIAI